MAGGAKTLSGEQASSRGDDPVAAGGHDAKLVVLRRPAVSARTGLGKSALYAQVKEGTFPKPIKLGPRAVGWIEAEIDAWLMERVADRVDTTWG